jgi:hypothetical protein
MQSNLPLPAVQMLLGHSTPNLVSSYVSYSEDDIQQVTRNVVEKEPARKITVISQCARLLFRVFGAAKTACRRSQLSTAGKPPGCDPCRRTGSHFAKLLPVRQFGTLVIGCRIHEGRCGLFLSEMPYSSLTRA